MIKKTLLISVGSVLFIIGMVLFPLPVPFGIPFMLVGLSLIFKASNKIKRKIIRLVDKNLHTGNAWQKIRAYRLRKKQRKEQS